MSSIMKQLEERIAEFEKGTLFSIQDFCDTTSYSTVKKSLQRLEKQNKIMRAIDGIYLSPSCSTLTGERFLPAPENIAQYIAKKNKWSIAPSGNRCLNILGLSTQLPMEYVYVCDGPSRRYDYLGTPITFKHVPQKEIRDISIASAVVIQALKILGKDHVDDDIIRQIRDRLSHEEKEQILRECVGITKWIRSYIESICGSEICRNS